MGVYFFESSALVKAYVSEQGSAWVRSLIDPIAGNDIFVVRTTEIEITSAVVRRQRSGSLIASNATAALAAFRQDLHNRFQVTEVELALVRLAVVMVQAHGLRAYDALQLATVVQANRLRTAAGVAPLTLVSADRELNAAATSEGLAVENPNQQP